MTQEERKDAIMFFKQVAEKEVNNAKYSKLAIEALQKEPCEIHLNCTDEEIANSFIEDVEAVKDLLPTTKNDLGVDCISRADARSLICKIDIKHRMLGMSRKAFKDLYNGMDELPSVTPQDQRKGHWIECMPGGAEEWCYKCSECNFYKFKKTINLRKFNYCPNCGAKMIEPQESEDKE